jgi:hypothetical protein
MRRAADAGGGRPRPLRIRGETGPRRRQRPRARPGRRACPRSAACARTGCGRANYGRRGKRLGRRWWSCAGKREGAEGEGVSGKREGARRAPPLPHGPKGRCRRPKRTERDGGTPRLAWAGHFLAGRERRSHQAAPWARRASIIRARGAKSSAPRCARASRRPRSALSSDLWPLTSSCRQHRAQASRKENARARISRRARDTSRLPNHPSYAMAANPGLSPGVDSGRDLGRHGPSSTGQRGVSVIHFRLTKIHEPFAPSCAACAGVTPCRWRAPRGRHAAIRTPRGPGRASDNRRVPWRAQSWHDSRCLAALGGHVTLRRALAPSAGKHTDGCVCVCVCVCV